jgi:hypothetical protein
MGSLPRCGIPKVMSDKVGKVHAYLFDTSGVLYHDFLLVTVEQAHP